MANLRRPAPSPDLSLRVGNPFDNPRQKWRFLPGAKMVTAVVGRPDLRGTIRKILPGAGSSGNSFGLAPRSGGAGALTDSGANV